MSSSYCRRHRVSDFLAKAERLRRMAGNAGDPFVHEALLDTAHAYEEAAREEQERHIRPLVAVTRTSAAHMHPRNEASPHSGLESSAPRCT
ncbi:protein of unknown function [Rhodovastum atsumiense]|nr:protein of unknown function [Rhodovastum atsumiense]